MQNKKISRVSLWLILAALFLSVLACEQAGDIISDAEATQRAIPTATSTPEPQEEIDSEFSVGDDVVFAGKGYLVPIFAEAGNMRVLSHAARGDSGVILNVILLNGEVWYQIDSVAGNGWANADSVAAPE